MIRELKKHKLAYTLLAIGLFTGIILFFGAWPDRSLQRFVAVGIGVFYSIWGVTTHFKSEQITLRVMYEYLGVSAVGTTVLLLITL